MDHLLISDIWIDICSILPISDLVRISGVNKIIREAAQLPTLWASHYKAVYSICDPIREANRRSRYDNDYRLMFFERARMDNEALRDLDDIYLCRRSRSECARSLVRLSYDIWNAIERESLSSLPKAIQGHGDGAHPSVTRSFWAREALQMIARNEAIQRWGALLDSAVDNSMSIEEGFSGLSAFFGVRPELLASQLDDIANQCREYLGSQSLSLDFEDALSLSAACNGICTSLRNQGFTAAAGPAFRHLKNHFPHYTLSSIRETIPLSLVYVFCAVAHRLGIDAGPVNFPGRVMAHIRSPKPEISDFYVDVFASDTKAILSRQGDLQPLLDTFVGNVDLDPDSAAHFIERSPITPMLRRSRRNIYASINEENINSSPAICALYATSVIGGMFEPGAGNTAATLSIVGRRVPLDVEAVMIDTLIPLIQPGIRERVKHECLAISEKEVTDLHSRQRRSDYDTPIAWSIGAVFRHIKYNYVACIVGWSPTCQADPSWIEQMQIDRLPRGQNQPFYSVIGLDTQERYVAEENIKRIPLTAEIAKEFFESDPIIARYFEDIILENSVSGNMGRMIPSPEIRYKFPEEPKD